jgi:hypothetical protein
MRQIPEFIAVLACALFTGAAVYITFIEHPARMQCGVEIAATEFAPSYRRATVMQVTCAAVGLLASFAAWLAGAGKNPGPGALNERLRFLLRRLGLIWARWLLFGLQLLLLLCVFLLHLLGLLLVLLFYLLLPRFIRVLLR